jgi:pyruvate/2-oxoglutarate dehydrogenase complex dihydrolipoamide dehydrogenase (E3) component
MLVESRRLGGDCTWFGCVPSKTLLRAARAAHEMRTADRFGLASERPHINFAQVMEHVRKTRNRIYEEADAPPNMERLGVDVVTGRACFINPHTIEVEEESNRVRRLTSRFFIIATGSRPQAPRFDETPLTNETVFELQARPERLVIIGAGPVGVEMAQAFTRLGSRVEVVTPEEGLLPRDDRKHAATLRECLSREGVVFHLGRKVTGLMRGPDGLGAVLSDGGTLVCDAALAALGREPVIEDLRLEAAGVRVGPQGIVIDSHCRTSQPHIYAAGDVTGRYNFTHMAEHMSKVAVTNAILRLPTRLDERHVVWCTFSDPELARLGESEPELKARGVRYKEYRFSFDRLDRAVTDAATQGEVKVFADLAGRILGVSILGANAGEMISEYALAMRNGLRLPDIANTIHPYPTFLLGNRMVADQYAARLLNSPFLGLLGRLLRYRGVHRGSTALVPPGHPDQ